MYDTSEGIKKSVSRAEAKKSARNRRKAAAEAAKRSAGIILELGKLTVKEHDDDVIEWISDLLVKGIENLLRL